MQKVKIKLSIDVTSNRQVMALANLLEIIGNDFEGKKPDEIKESYEEARETTTKVMASVKEEIKETLEESPKNKKPKTEAPTKPEKKEEATQGVTIERLREMTADKAKVDGKREALRAKLAEFGAKSVSALPVEHYEAYYQFLNTL